MSPERGTTPTRQRLPRGEGEHLREEILDAAEELLSHEGDMDRVSMRAVAKAVGVTPPALYLHFADKDEMFFAVCNRRFEDFEQVMRAATDGLTDTFDLLRAMGDAYIRYGLERGEHYQLLFGPKMTRVAVGRDLSNSAGTRAFALLVGVIQGGIDAGLLRAGDATSMAFAVWSAVHGAVMLVQSKEALAEEVPLPAAEALSGVISDLVERGLSAAAAAVGGA